MSCAADCGAVAKLAPAELVLKMEGNDMPNVETVLNKSAEADYTLVNDGAPPAFGRRLNRA